MDHSTVLVANIRAFLTLYPEHHWQQGQCFDFASTHFYDFLTNHQAKFALLAGQKAVAGQWQLVHVIVDIPATGTTWDNMGPQAKERCESRVSGIAWLSLGARLP